MNAVRGTRVLALILSLLAACGRAEQPPSPAREAELVVFAAASLRDAFSALGIDFERAHPGVEVTFNFAGTQELRAQLEHGAAVDVFASADQRHMAELLRASRVASPVVFARSEPVVIVAYDAREVVRSLGELPSAQRIVLGAPEVPIGRYSLALLERARASLGEDFAARVQAKVVSRELNVRQVLAKVSLGEAQAGIVYRTDAQSARDRVSVVPIPPEVNVVAEYPIAVVSDAPHPQLARAWVDYVLSPEGQRALAKSGFSTPAGESQ